MRKSLIIPLFAAAAFAGTLETVPAADKAAPVFKCPDKKVVEEANAEDLFRYALIHRSGTYTSNVGKLGKLLVQAVAANAGDTSVDEPLLKHLRFLMEPDNTIPAHGGYAAQHERNFTTAVILVRNVPRLWNKLTAEEKHKLDLLVKASLVGSAFTCNDKFYPDKKSKGFTLDASNNFHRTWNPNFREGMVGGLIAGACWLGPENAQKFLDEYDHEKFTAELKKANLGNTFVVFDWRNSRPELPGNKWWSKARLKANAPTPEKVNESVHNFRYFGMDLTSPMKLYLSLTDYTYSGIVNPGLNKGEGRKGGGKMVSGADKLPNLGKKGMLKEFSSGDARGGRSSVIYSYGGFRANLANQLALIATGNFDYNDPAWPEVFSRLMIGNQDLFYKLDHGYIDYSKGKADKAPYDINSPKWDFKWLRSLWFDSVLPYHLEHTPKVKAVK